jgi:molybdate transport system substrate-binding protein
MRILRVGFFAALLLALSGGCAVAAELVLFAGAASKPATQELVGEFEAQTGHTVRIHFGNSGNVLFQMKISGQGDVYFPGSPDFMDHARREGLVLPETSRNVVYLVPAINVQRGNPKAIKDLHDLTRSDVRVAIGNPHTVIVGTYAVEIFERAGLLAQVKPRISGYAESCAKTANLLMLNGVDAIIGWRAQESWNPEHIETVLLPPERIPRISYMPIAVSAFSKDTERARLFIEFACSERGKRIFEKWGYLTREEDARAYAPRAVIGGEYVLPAGW